MTFMTDRASRGEGRQGLFHGLLGRIAARLDRARPQRRGAGGTTIEIADTPERVLRDIGLLDGRQVIPLWREESLTNRWR